MQIKPLSDYVVVKPLEPEEKTQGKIIIPDTAQEKPMQGEVVAIGPGKITESGQRIAMEVKKGDKVLYSKYGGREVPIEGKDYLILRESEILAII